MEPSAVALVLLAGLLHAGWNAVLRFGGDRLVVMALLNASAGLVALVLLPTAPLPAGPAWPVLLLSVALHTGYKYYLVRAYAHGDLGQVYPIARGTAPLLVCGLAWTVLGETLRASPLLAVALTSVAVAALALRGGVPLRTEWRGIGYALVTAGFIAAYTVTDAAGARLAGSPHAYTLWLFVLDGAAFAAFVALLQGAPLVRLVPRVWRKALVGGTMSLVAYWLVIWALTLGPAAPVAALRETSVLFAALLATFVLKEPFGRWRIVSAVVVALGVVLLRL